MKVYVYPADTNGCGFYRLIWPAMAARAQGHDVQVVLPSQRDYGDFAIRGEIRDDKILNLDFPADADVMVFQRVTHRYLSHGLRYITQRGTAVVVDMDDDLSHIHPNNPAYTYLHPRSGDPEHSWLNAEVACSQATVVTTSTRALLKTYAPRGNGVVLHNAVCESMLELPRLDDGTFGWTGSLHSHPNDPAVMGATVQQLVNEGYGFSMIGNPEGVAREFRVAPEQVHSPGIVTTQEWARALSVLHVGIAPLADTRFNQAKSWLKPLELGALGIPCVMSPRAEYVRINKLGVGVLANSPRDWYRQIKRLMDDAAWYEEVSNRSKTAITSLTVEANAWRWVEAWEAAWRQVRRPAPVLRSGT